MKRTLILLCAALAGVVAGFELPVARAEDAAAKNLNGSAAAVEPVYTRVAHPDTNTVQLQIAVRKLVMTGGKGPVIWLVGVAHIGDAVYYHTIQKRLDAQTVVLYEGVNTDSHKRHVGKPEVPEGDKKAEEAAAKDGLQTALAKALGLQFQLDALTTTAPIS